MDGWMDGWWLDGWMMSLILDSVSCPVRQHRAEASLSMTLNLLQNQNISPLIRSWNISLNLLLIFMTLLYDCVSLSTTVSCVHIVSTGGQYNPSGKPQAGATRPLMDALEFSIRLWSGGKSHLDQVCQLLYCQIKIPPLLCIKATFWKRSVSQYHQTFKLY